MPDIDGVELAETIKATKPLFSLVALSSVSEFINTSNFEAKLDKPVNKLQLFNVIHKIISHNINDSSYIGEGKSPFRKNTFKHNLQHSKFSRDVKILIAEDVVYNQTLLHNMVTDLGYSDITVASDGQETIEKLDNAYESKTPYHILLLDICSKGYPLPKIVAVTASVLQEDRDRCKKMGVQYFINKPINMLQLKNVLLKTSQKE
jgi:CheY-like chemotaxis protein